MKSSFVFIVNKQKYWSVMESALKEGSSTATPSYTIDMPILSFIYFSQVPYIAGSNAIPAFQAVGLYLLWNENLNSKRFFCLFVYITLSSSLSFLSVLLLYISEDFASPEYYFISKMHSRFFSGFPTG